MLTCVYGPKDWMRTTGYVAYYFWHERTPADLATAKPYYTVEGTLTHPFGMLARVAVPGCPATESEARRLR